LALALFGASRVLAVTDNPQAQAALDNAQATWDREENDQALQLFEGVVNDFPETEQASMALAMIGLWWKEDGDQAQAFETWYRVLQEYPGSEGHAEAWALIGGTAAEEGDYAKALVYWDMVIRNFLGTWQEARARFWRAGFRWEVQKEYDRAARDYLRVVELAPRDPMATEAELLIGYHCLLMGDIANSLAWCDRLVTEHPDAAQVPEALYRRGYCKGAMGDVEGGLADVEQAATIAQGWLKVNALLLAGSFYGQLGQQKEARARWQAVLDLPEAEFPQLRAEALYLIGESYFPERRYSEARPWFERVLSEYPSAHCAPLAEQSLGAIPYLESAPKGGS
jgi:TolA-binding protein